MMDRIFSDLAGAACRKAWGVSDCCVCHNIMPGPKGGGPMKCMRTKDITIRPTSRRFTHSEMISAILDLPEGVAASLMSKILCHVHDRRRIPRRGILLIGRGGRCGEL